jgi:hypothetical protein
LQMKPSTLALTIAALAVLGAASATAQQPPGGKPAVEAKSIDKASPKKITGKVTHVDDKSRSFTVTANGREQRFSLGAAATMPKAGDVVDVTYTVGSDGAMMAINLNSSKSNAY